MLWRHYRAMIPPIFAASRQLFFDASTTAALGLDDRYRFDGFPAFDMYNSYLLLRVSHDPLVASALPYSPEPAGGHGDQSVVSRSLTRLPTA